MVARHIMLESVDGQPVSRPLDSKIVNGINTLVTSLTTRGYEQSREGFMRMKLDADSRFFQQLARTENFRPDPRRADALWDRLGVRQDSAWRADNASFGGQGIALPRQLEYIHQRVLEEKRAVPSALRMFKQATRIPLGARSHTVRRFQEIGEASWYRAGQDVPGVRLSQNEEVYPVRHIVTSISTNHFELLSSNYAGIAEYERKMRTARRTIEMFLNKNLWAGAPNQKFLGILSYPYLAKFVSSVTFDAATDADTILAELNKAANYPANNSKDVFMPNRMATSTRVRNFLMNTPRGSVNDTTIGEFFTRNNEYISSIESAWELKNVGGAGFDGILFYHDEEDSICHEMSQGITVLPQQSFGFDNITYVYMTTGGIVMRDAGNNILMLVPVGSSVG